MTGCRWPAAYLTIPSGPELAPWQQHLAKQALGRLLKQSRLGLDSATHRAIQRLQVGLTRWVRATPARVLTALQSPDVLPYLLGMALRRLPADTALKAAIPHLLAALEGPCPAPLRWDLPVELVAWPARGRLVRLPHDTRGMILDNQGLSVLTERGRMPIDHASLDSQAAFPSITPTLQLALHDTNPFSDVEAHPDKAGNALDLGGKDTTTWIEAYQRALGIIERTLPAWHAELPTTLRRIVPVGWQDELHMSASAKVSPGMAWMSLHPSALTLAEAVVHETQHGKLNTVLWRDKVLHNGQSVWTPSPVRPDLRPLMGVLLAVHAFVPVALMHRALLDDGDPFCETGHFQRRYLEVLAGNRRGLEILDELAEPTDVGKRVLDGLRALHAVAMDGAPQLPARLRDALPPG